MHGKAFDFLKKKKNVGKGRWTIPIMVLCGEDFGR